MEYKNIGKSDLRVSVVGFGAWQAGGRGWGTDFTDNDVIKAMKYGFENGVNYIDTAEIYGSGHSEEVISRALEGYRREDIIIATKVAPPHFRKDDVINSCDRSLRRLNTSYIDLYQLHWPDSSVPIKETISAMEKLVDSGKVRYIGVCNYPLAKLQEVLEALSKHDLVSNQMRYNLIQREVETDLVPFMRNKSISMIAWSPIAKGLLSGKYSPGNLPRDEIRQRDSLFSKENVEKLMPLIEKIREIAVSRSKTPSQVALNYLICQESFVIPGIKSTDQLMENMGAADWRLTDGEVSELQRASSIVPD
ncbi:MAG: aldo/keto reductase [Thermoplasmataceae archaeon]|jgi:aryl-alcohol dehydrogenase-like predicted oxidoreductase